MLGLKQTHELAGSQNDVDIVGAAATHGEQGSLAFLGNAGHYGNRADLLGLQALLLGEVGFQNSAKNLLGRFSGGQVGHERRVFFGHIADPAGAAGGEHGPTIAFRVLQAL